MEKEIKKEGVKMEIKNQDGEYIKIKNQDGDKESSPY